MDEWGEMDEWEEVWDRCPQGCWEILGHSATCKNTVRYRFRQAGVGRKAGHLGQGRQLTSESLPELGAGGGFPEGLGQVNSRRRVLKC